MPWARRRYRGNKVWVAVDETGGLEVDARGLARVRYRNEEGEREYTVRTTEVRPLDGDDDPAPKPAAAPAAPDAMRPAPDPADDGPPGDDVPALAGLRVHAYTDGAASGNPGPAGIGVVLLFRERKKEVSRYLGETTNNVAELTAILEALRLVRQRDLPVRLHSDSTYAIGVVTGALRAKANADLVSEIRAETQRFRDLRFVKVEAHAGVEWNERADALAREAIRKHGPR